MLKLNGAIANGDLNSIAVRRRVEMSNGLVGATAAVADFVVVAAAILVVDMVYHHHLSGGLSGSQEGRSAAMLVASLFAGVQCLQRAYDLQSGLDLRRQLRLVLIGWCAVFFIIGWVGFLMKITTDYSRVVLTISFVLGPVVLVASRLLWTGMLRRGLADGRITLRKAFLISAGDEVQRARIIQQAARNGVQIVGWIDVGREATAQEGARILEEVRAAFGVAQFGEIYLFLPWQNWRPLSEVTMALNHMPLPVYLFGTEEMGTVLRARPLHVGQLTGFEVQRSPLSGMERTLKRLLDVAVAAGALLLLSPLLLLVSAAILVESGRPVVFRQSRKGFGGRPFTIYKFRTMRVCENGGQITQATRNDVRVTRLGAVLRRTSVDELPQLFNVLRGEMSIVGPRPHAIAHDHYYDALIATYAYRHHVTPGLTGWAQVNGLRGETRALAAMEDRVKHDIWYINNWSVWLDIQIIVRTAATLLAHKHAY